MSNSSDIGIRMGDDNHCSSLSEEEEESLSLRDLPTVGDQEDDGKRRGIGESETAKSEVVGEFNFGSLVASLDELEGEMCAADEVFFRGQILPSRRYSATSTSGVVWRSESMERIAGFRGSSTASTSRSSSTRSSSINSSASAGKLGHEKRPLKVLNQFHSFPSPKPYAHAANAPRSAISSTGSASKRSALWEIFRLSLVRTPEIELEDLKVRYSKNAQSHGIKDGSSGDEIKKGARRKTERKRRKGGAMKMMSSGCRCSVGAVEPERGERVNKRREEECRSRLRSEPEEEEEEMQGRTDVSLSRHHRTFQWLEDLSQSQSHADVTA